jgi:hypothetical protein
VLRLTARAACTTRTRFCDGLSTAALAFGLQVFRYE